MTNSVQGGRLYCWQHLQNAKDESLSKLREEHAEEVAKSEKKHNRKLIALQEELDCAREQLNRFQNEDSNRKAEDPGKVEAFCQTMRLCVRSSQELEGAP